MLSLCAAGGKRVCRIAGVQDRLQRMAELLLYILYSSGQVFRISYYEEDNENGESI